MFTDGFEKIAAGFPRPPSAGIPLSTKSLPKPVAPVVPTVHSTSPALPKPATSAMGAGQVQGIKPIKLASEQKKKKFEIGSVFWQDGQPAKQQSTNDPGNKMGPRMETAALGAMSNDAVGGGVTGGYGSN